MPNIGLQVVSDALLSCATAMETGAAEVNPVDALVDSLMSTVPAMLAVFSEVAGPVASFAQFRSFSTSFFLVNSGRSRYRIGRCDLPSSPRWLEA